MNPHAVQRALVTILAALSIAVSGCTTSPATGKRIFTGGMSLSDAERLSAEQHPKILAQFGGEYQDPALRSYVSSIGRLLAATSELPDLDWRFTVLDSPIVNAFALPGGYVYVTRGLIALADDEAQLAGVLAHEIGHVTARHPAERYGGSILAGVGGLAAGILLGDAGAQTVGALSQVALASYSRSQEFEADTLGVRYISRAGYDPHAMAGFLRKMQMHSALQARLLGDPAAADSFNLLQTHPRTVERVESAIESAGLGRVEKPMLARDLYLSKLEGLLYGYGPEEGYVRGTRFAHPQLRFAFRVPDGFTLFNSSQAVVARGPEGAVILFDGREVPETLDVATYLRSRWARNLKLDRLERVTLDGMPAAAASLTASGRQGPRALRLLAIRFDGERVYRFLFVAAPSETAALDRWLRDTAGSFRRLDVEEAAALQPLRLTIHRVTPGDTVEKLARLLPFDSLRERHFRVLNGLEDGATLEGLDRVKMVR